MYAHLTKVVLLGAAAAAAIAAAPVPAPVAKLGTWGVDLTAMDRTVRPGDDFARYVNGAWIARTQIAPDRTSAGSFITLTDQAESNVRGIVEGLDRETRAAPENRKIADLYASWMDEPGIAARGTQPLAPYLARIDAVRDRAGLIQLFATPGYDSPIAMGIRPDPDAPTRYAVSIRQGSLGLPGRDYYLREGPKFDAVRTAYRTYLTQIGTLAGFADPAARADRVIALETRLATDQWAPERRRDVKQTTNRMTAAELNALAPQVDWTAYLTARGLPTAGPLIVGEKSAIAATGQRLDDVPLATWKDYLALHFISDHAQYLPASFDDAKFQLFGRVLGDQPSQRARWKRGVALVNSVLGEQVGRIYAERFYPPESDRQMHELIEDLRASYRELIANAPWMDEATRAEAQAKLAAFDPRIGHPSKYIDYSSLAVKRDDLLGNAVRGESFQWKLQLSRFPKPVDRTLWGMTPQTVNAYYSPPTNQITFPAAILQPPFFDPAADAAVNYGAIAAVIGHEMGHGFDDQGRQFDASGKLRDWWSPQTSAAYTARADALARQYDGYEALPGQNVNGRLTLGENLGDLGGMQAAYTAYHRYVARHGASKVIDGLTGDQRFFIAYAQVWQDKMREGALRQRVLTDPHSPAVFRINGIVRNMDAWYAAFGVKSADKLYLPPAQRIHVW